MRTQQLTLLALAAACAAASARADEPSPAPEAREVRRQVELVMAQADTQAAMARAEAHAAAAVAASTAAMAAEGNVAFMGSEMNHGPVVKGAPYCADAVHETVQPLADGNRIVRTQTTRLCRDGEGRVRQEVERDGNRKVFLRDPVAKESWMLDTEKKTALKLGPVGQVDHAAWREYAERMREWAQKVKGEARTRLGRDGSNVPPVPPVPPVHAAPPTPPEPVVITQSDETFKDGDGRQRREVRVLRINNAPGAPGAPLSPLTELRAPLAPQAVMTRALHFAPRGPGEKAPLGSRDIEGLKASGERTTWTIDAGKVGNERPIVITREVWTSPDLSVTLSTRDFDPRTGEVNYRLQNLRRGEPDATLMKVPTDYTVKAIRTPAPPSAPHAPSLPRSPRPAASAPSAKG